MCMCLCLCAYAYNENGLKPQLASLSQLPSENESWITGRQKKRNATKKIWIKKLEEIWWILKRSKIFTWSMHKQKNKRAIKNLRHHFMGTTIRRTVFFLDLIVSFSIAKQNEVFLASRRWRKLFFLLLFRLIFSFFIIAVETFAVQPPPPPHVTFWLL